MFTVWRMKTVPWNTCKLALRLYDNRADLRTHLFLSRLLLPRDIRSLHSLRTRLTWRCWTVYTCALIARSLFRRAGSSVYDVQAKLFETQIMRAHKDRRRRDKFKITARAVRPAGINEDDFPSISSSSFSQSGTTRSTEPCTVQRYNVAGHYYKTYAVMLRQCRKFKLDI